MNNIETKYSLDCWFKTLEYLGFEIKNDTINSRIYIEKNKLSKTGYDYIDGWQEKIKYQFKLQVKINFDSKTKNIYSIYIDRCKFIEEGALWTEITGVDFKEFEKYFKEEFRNTNLELLIS